MTAPPRPDRFARFPAALAARARSVRFDGIPALLAHPDWQTPAPVVVWLHGRTVSKELDPGRYLRWIRAGIAACAIDLPGHGERLDESFHSPARTLDLLDLVLPEIDRVVEALASPEFAAPGTPAPAAAAGAGARAPGARGLFDLDRLALGGMSAGGMATLRRLCDDHPFRCACVEAAAGSLECLYAPSDGRPWPVRHPPDRVARLDPLRHLGAWRPVPLLALHSEADRLVPVRCVRVFIDELRRRYAAAGADPAAVELVTWPETGAPDEHSGFGRVSNDAKNIQTAFLVRHLRPALPDPTGPAP